MNKILTICLIMFLFGSAKSATVTEKIYILSDSLTTIDNVKFPYITFNYTPDFSQNNPIIELNQNDSLSLWVVNFDSITHDFIIGEFSTTAASIPSGDSIHIGYTFNNPAVYIYHDPINYPTYQYLGLSGLIVVKNHTHNSFYWNIKEHNSNWNETLMNSGNVDWTLYNPKHFTINGNSNPDINNDPLARIVGNVGDTLILNMANTGQSIHSMHFHGYHATILYSSKSSLEVNRSKDTFPIYPGESLILRIIPDKEGEYPVHDHNLVAISANNLYPNGMFSTILIAP